MIDRGHSIKADVIATPLERNQSILQSIEVINGYKGVFSWSHAIRDGNTIVKLHGSLPGMWPLLLLEFFNRTLTSTTYRGYLQCINLVLRV